ncbi:DMT family transporter [Alphaproteobacteria bacterium]|nr:DMT family transporter [Alphaproteobacteria bacterium]
MKFHFLNSQIDDNPISALCMIVFGVIILSLQDGLIKYMAPNTSFWQFQLIRSIGNIILLCLIAKFTIGFHSLLPLNWKAVYFRAFMMTSCMFCFFAASPILSLAQMAAGLYTYPIFVSILAVLILKETIKFWRFLALITGCLGALLILEPWSVKFTAFQLLPIIAGFFFASNIVLIRKYCRKETVVALTLAVGVMFFISACLGIILFDLIFYNDFLRVKVPFVFIGWPKLTLIIFIFSVSCSLLNVTGNILLAKAYQTAESSWLAPIDYSYLIFAAIWGKLLFDVWPTYLNIIGISFIAVSGILIAWRERCKA